MLEEDEKQGEDCSNSSEFSDTLGHSYKICGKGRIGEMTRNHLITQINQITSNKRLIGFQFFLALQSIFKTTPSVFKSSSIAEDRVNE
jgi:hypothetical protein